MKRAHRRVHLLLWPVVYLTAALGLVAAMRAAPVEPVSEIPSAILTEDS